MKAILISIKPEFVRLILNGDKTIEVRKSAPNTNLPITCYIYCTKEKTKLSHPVYSGYAGSYNAGGHTFYEGERYSHEVLIKSERGIYFMPRPLGKSILLNGKVVAKFTLNKCEKICETDMDFYSYEDILVGAVLCEKELHDYTKGKDFYAWHISDLVIFDKPMELRQFYTEPKRCRSECQAVDHLCSECKLIKCNRQIIRPPQSWQYVEVKNEI